jgi:hypothetical protein
MPALLVPFLSTMTLIVSWNVAGLSTTANRIHDAYHQPSTTEDDAMKKPASIKKMQSLPSSSLAKYLQLHQIDHVQNHVDAQQWKVTNRFGLAV